MRPPAGAHARTHLALDSLVRARPVPARAVGEAAPPVWRRSAWILLVLVAGLILGAGVAGRGLAAPVPAPTPTPILAPVTAPPATPGPSATPTVPAPNAPGLDGCGLVDVACRVQEGVSDAIRTGFLGIVDLAVAAFGWTLSWLAAHVFAKTTVTVDDAFYGVYNDVASVVGLFVLLMFAFSLGINALRARDGGPVRIVLGLLRAVLGITFAGGIAFTLVRLWDEATLALIDRNQARDWEPAVWLTALHELGAEPGTALIALIIAVASLAGLLLIAIILFFRGILAIGAALIGVAAMAGQAMDATRPWGRRWFWTTNALAASKFWIVAFWIYGTRAPYESDNLVNALRGLLIIFLMVAAPWILLRLTTILDGYIADLDPPGFLGAAGMSVGTDVLSDWAQHTISKGSSGGPDAGTAGSIPSVVDSPATDTSTPDTAPDGTAAGDPATATGTGESPGATGKSTGAGTPHRDEAAGTAQDHTTLTGAGKDAAAGSASGQPDEYTSTAPDGSRAGTPAGDHTTTSTTDTTAGPGRGASGATASPVGGSGAAAVPQPAAPAPAPASGPAAPSSSAEAPSTPTGIEPATADAPAPSAGIGRGTAATGAASELPVVPL
ncbi:hypothetical protein [Catenuloplanes nepalensis]|nr:hypothetical protein [Catenuloplanes nepalensis]